LLPDVVAYLEKQKPWVSCGHNTGFVAGLIGMVPLELRGGFDYLPGTYYSKFNIRL
jgi:hypothetical protein